MMDVFWLVVVLLSWRVLTRDYWRTQIVPADARVWAWFAKLLPERGLLALYRATFFYGVCRMISWSVWAHVAIEDFPLRPVVDGTVVDRRPHAAPRQPVDRRPGDAGAARARSTGW